MASVTLKGNPVNTCGDLPAVGSVAPNFVLSNAKLADTALKDYAGKKKILNKCVQVIFLFSTCSAPCNC